MAVLYTSERARGEEWSSLFAARAPGIPFRIWPEIGDHAEIRYMISWIPPKGIFDQLPNLELLFSIGAGVDQLDLSEVPSDLPVVRMVEPGLVAGMVDYVAMSVLALHRDLPVYLAYQREKAWKPQPVVLAENRRVGVLGLGQLGQAACSRLVSLGFQVSAWSRSRRDVAGVCCFSGQSGMGAFLARCDILVCLLPLTDATRGILNRHLFEQLPRGASLVSVGRGGHLDQNALLEALECGQLSSAFLDVTTPEPLPGDSPLWSHPRVLITPHVASKPRAETAIDALVENIRRHGEGRPLIGLIDRQRGY